MALEQYPFISELKAFFAAHPLDSCLKNGKVCPAACFDFLRTLANQTGDSGICISLMVNIITLTMFQQHDQTAFTQYHKPLIKGEIITAIANNEAFHHGSNLNSMTSFIKFNADGSIDINLNKPLVSNAGAADLIIASVPVAGQAKNKFALLLLDAQEVQQQCFSEQLAGLKSCPTGSIRAEYKNITHTRLVTDTRSSLMAMREIYNWERFLLGCIMTGILKKILNLALKEMDEDKHEKFSNQYLQDKIINIFDAFIRLESLVKNCIDFMKAGKPVDPILSIIKLACINDVQKAILLLKEIYGGKSFFKDHLTTKMLADQEALNNLGGTRELMKLTLWENLKKHKIRDLYV